MDEVHEFCLRVLGDGAHAADVDKGLAAAAAAEVHSAIARLPERHREALALREALAHSHEQIASVMALDRAAVAPLLARARLRLREERRGVAALVAECEHRDRALRSLACRQDSEPVSIEDNEWLLEHLRGCRECEAAHAAMLEASVSYRTASPVGTRERAMERELAPQGR